MYYTQGKSVFLLKNYNYLSEIINTFAQISE